jgi:hypothetical protein
MSAPHHGEAGPTNTDESVEGGLVPSEELTYGGERADEVYIARLIHLGSVSLSQHALLLTLENDTASKSSWVA